MPLDPRKPIGPLFFSATHTKEESTTNKNNSNNIVLTKPISDKPTTQLIILTSKVVNTIINKTSKGLDRILTNKSARRVINNTSRKISNISTKKILNYANKKTTKKYPNYSPRFIGDNGSTPAEIGASIYAFLSLFDLIKLMRVSIKFRSFISQLKILNLSTANNKRSIETELDERKYSHTTVKKIIRLSKSDEKIKEELFSCVENDEYNLIGMHLSNYIKLKYTGYVSGLINLKLFNTIIYPLLLHTISKRKIHCFNEITKVIQRKNLLNYFFNDYFDVDQFLIREDQSSAPINPLTYVIKKEFTEFIRPILDLPQNRLLQPAIDSALKNNDLDIIEKIISPYKANPEEPSLLTATRIACNFNDPKIISHLLSNGYNVNEANQDGTTALHVAISCKNSDVACVLLNAGANCEAFSSAFGTIMERAKKANQSNITILIKKKFKEQKEQGKISPYFNFLENRRKLKQENEFLTEQLNRQSPVNTKQNENISTQILAKSLATVLTRNSNDNASPINSNNSNIDHSLESSSSSYN